MSFLDLATLSLRRRHEMEERIKILTKSCDDTTSNLNKLKLRAQSCLDQLNCDPSELNRRFLQGMSQLDELIVLVSDINHAIEKIVEPNLEYMPVHDTPINTLTRLPQPVLQPLNLLDFLSEPTPSTSISCPNSCPAEKPKSKKISKKDQTLITFSSASSSAESVPITKNNNEDVVEDMTKLNIEGTQNKASHSPTAETSDQDVSIKLPGQAMLETDYLYNVTIVHVDGINFWVVVEDDELCKYGKVYHLMLEMTDYYKKKQVEITLQDLTGMTYCAFNDKEAFYRALFLGLTEHDKTKASIFLVDTGEMMMADVVDLQPLVPQFTTKPPYARVCHLSGVEYMNQDNELLMAQQESFLKEYVGTPCTIEVEDNSSESLGVYVILQTKETLNDLLIKQGLALSSTTHHSTPLSEPPQKSEYFPPLRQGPPEVDVSDISVTDCPEYDDPVEAVMGYHNRDEIDICKNYKGGPEKTCFKGARCKKRHVLKHPDGWTLDRVPINAKLKTLPLPQPGTWHKVYVSYVAHLDTVYVQFDNNESKEIAELPQFGVVMPPSTLPALVKDMNSPATRISYKPLKISPAIGEVVAALYPLDDLWYRARVLSLVRSDQNVENYNRTLLLRLDGYSFTTNLAQYEVVYIDYGNTLWVKEDQIKVLDKRYLNLPEQAVVCKLAGVEPMNQSITDWAAAKKLLTNLACDKHLQCRIVARDFDRLTIELLDAEGYIIAEQLAASNLVKFSEYLVEDDSDVIRRVAVP